MKKLSWVLLLGFCLLGLIFLSSCKKQNAFDINGRWTLSLRSFNGFITFTGSETSGTLYADFSSEGWDPGNGTYTVTGNSVNFTINWTGNGNISWCVGSAVDDNNMNGTTTELYGDSGTWSATR